MNTDRIVVVWFRTFALAALGLILWLLCNGCVAAPVPQCPPNLAFVDRPEIWRSGQPTTVEQWQLVSSMGVSNVVKLNGGKDAPPPGLNIKVVQFKISTWQQIFGPVEPQLREALTNIGPGTLFHCTKGSNRTGTLGILYRIEHDHWTKEQAIEEAKRYGWGSSFPALKNFVYKHL